MTYLILWKGPDVVFEPIFLLVRGGEHFGGARAGVRYCAMYLALLSWALTASKVKGCIHLLETCWLHPDATRKRGWRTGFPEVLHGVIYHCDQQILAISVV